MAGSPASFKKPHGPVYQEKPSSKSYPTLFCKSLIIILVLVVIPLFPAQAPDFMNQSILSKFWELLHLLVIGVAVSYGLFCRKCAKMEVENQSRNNTCHAYLSGVLNVPSFFEDGSENLCISDEKKNMQNWDSLSSMSKENSPVDTAENIRSWKVGSSIKNMNEADKENFNQIWNSQHFRGETFVVLTNGNYAADEHKPLGLPIRSLRSRIADNEKREFISRSGSSSSLKDSFGNNSDSKVEKSRSPIPTNLEKKFEEVAGPSTIPWKSRSGRRMEMREEVSDAEPPCHFKSHSGGNFEPQNLKSRSFRHPLSSRISCVSSEPSKPETENLGSKIDTKSFLDTVPPTTLASVNDGASFDTKPRGFSIGSSRELDMRKTSRDSKKDTKSFSDTVSPSTLASVNDGASVDTTARGFSIGSSRELDMRKTPRDYFNDSNIRAMQDMLDRGKKSGDSINSNAKPSKLGKVLPRGRSVRTIRSGVCASDEMKRKENYSNQINDNIGSTSDQFEAPAIAEKGKGGESRDPPAHTQKQNSTKIYPVPKETLSEYHNDERQNFADSALASENNSQLESESDDFCESSDEKEAETHHIDEAEIEGSEVDRKADEFIAMFREQMRLQKIASIKRNGYQA